MQTAEPSDFSDVSVTMLDLSFVVNEDNFKTFPPNSVVILDDFSFRTSNVKQAKADFLRVINYALRHQKISLFLIIHNLFGNHLFNDIIYASHLFLSYSNIGYLIMSKIYLRLGGLDALNFYQKVPKANYHFAYINSKRNYIINTVEQLFTRTPNVRMFTKQQEFTIHASNTSCGDSNSDTLSSQNLKSEIDELISTLYPKQKCLKIVSNVLLKHDLINQDLCFTDEPSLHFVDFIRFINNRFDKSTKPDLSISRLCKQFQIKHIRFPNICVKNPLAQKYLC